MASSKPTPLYVPKEPKIYPGHEPTYGYIYVHWLDGYEKLGLIPTQWPLHRPQKHREKHHESKETAICLPRILYVFHILIIKL